LESVPLADDVEAFATLMFVDRFLVIVVIVETAFITSSSVGDKLVLDEGAPRALAWNYRGV
jgi:hypothetical protein